MCVLRNSGSDSAWDREAGASLQSFVIVWKRIMQPSRSNPLIHLKTLHSLSHRGDQVTQRPQFTQLCPLVKLASWLAIRANMLSVGVNTRTATRNKTSSPKSTGYEFVLPNM